ncbi:DinB family protein [Chloroflexota bacterium]
MELDEMLIAGLERIAGTLERTLNGLAVEDLNWQPKPDSNSIGWLTWHLTRWQDVQVASFLGEEQIWIKGGWHKKFGRPADAKDHGAGHKPEDLAKFKSPDVATQLGYNKAVLAQARVFFSKLSPGDLDKVVEGTPFQPPPTVGMSLVGLLSDGLQHAGQASYVRGLRQGMGWH